MQGNFLLCRLPSGRKLWFYRPNIKVESTKFGDKEVLKYTANVMGKPMNDATYGGHLTGMVTQGTARDLMTEAMMRLKNKGYDLVLTVHDEIVAEVDPEIHPLEHFKATMEEVPAWAEGIPIKTSAWAAKRFHK
jgi:DNA polymerase